MPLKAVGTKSMMADDCGDLWLEVRFTSPASQIARRMGTRPKVRRVVVVS